jgi:hypothetical protein
MGAAVIFIVYNRNFIRSKLVCTYLPFLVQGLGLCVVYNEILRLSSLLVVVWFLVLHMHPASIVYVADIELQAGPLRKKLHAADATCYKNSIFTSR